MEVDCGMRSVLNAEFGMRRLWVSGRALTVDRSLHGVRSHITPAGMSTAHGASDLPLLPSGPGGVHRRSIAQVPAIIATACRRLIQEAGRE
jgi:hypothetical protein